ncbi:MAG TPA: hypothetical protein VF018_08895 [Acidobacteriaceae bacterium]
MTGKIERITESLSKPDLFNESYYGIHTLAHALVPSCECVWTVSPMIMKMIQKLKLMKRNSGLALSTIFGRVIRPDRLA